MKTEETKNGKKVPRHAKLVIYMAGIAIDAGQLLHQLATCTKISFNQNIYPNLFPEK